MALIFFLLLIVIAVVIAVKSKSAHSYDSRDFSDEENQEVLRIGEIRKQGVQYFNAGDFHSAINEFDKVTKYIPDHYFAYFYKATAKFMLDDYEGALNDYDKATGITSDPWMVYEGRANTKLRLSYARGIPSLRDDALADFNYAISLINEAVKKDSGNGDLYLKRSNIKRDIFDEEGADEDILKAAKLGCSEAIDYLNKREKLRSRND